MLSLAQAVAAVAVSAAVWLLVVLRRKDRNIALERQAANISLERKAATRDRLYFVAVWALEAVCSGTAATPLTMSAYLRDTAGRVSADDGAAVRSWLATLRARVPHDVCSLWNAVRTTAAARPPPPHAPETDQRSLQAVIDAAGDTGPAAARAGDRPPQHYHEAALAGFLALRPLWAGTLRLFHELSWFSGAYRPDFVFAPAKEAAAAGNNTLTAGHGRTRRLTPSCSCAATFARSSSNTCTACWNRQRLRSPTWLPYREWASSLRCTTSCSCASASC
jgi:hypothetical protein